MRCTLRLARGAAAVAVLLVGMTAVAVAQAGYDSYDAQGAYAQRAQPNFQYMQQRGEIPPLAFPFEAPKLPADFALTEVSSRAAPTGSQSQQAPRFQQYQLPPSYANQQHVTYERAAPIEHPAFGEIPYHPDMGKVEVYHENGWGYNPLPEAHDHDIGARAIELPDAHDIVKSVLMETNAAVAQTAAVDTQATSAQQVVDEGPASSLEPIATDVNAKDVSAPVDSTMAKSAEAAALVPLADADKPADMPLAGSARFASATTGTLAKATADAKVADAAKAGGAPTPVVDFSSGAAAAAPSASGTTALPLEPIQDSGMSTGAGLNPATNPTLPEDAPVGQGDEGPTLNEVYDEDPDIKARQMAYYNKLKSINSQKDWVVKVRRIIRDYQNKVFNVQAAVSLGERELAADKTQIQRMIRSKKTERLRGELIAALGALKQLEGNSSDLNQKITDLSNTKSGLRATILRIKAALGKTTDDEALDSPRFKELTAQTEHMDKTNNDVKSMFSSLLQYLNKVHPETDEEREGHEAALSPQRSHRLAHVMRRAAKPIDIDTDLVQADVDPTITKAELNRRFSETMAEANANDDLE